MNIEDFGSGCEACENLVFLSRCSRSMRLQIGLYNGLSRCELCFRQRRPSRMRQNAEQDDADAEPDRSVQKAERFGYPTYMFPPTMLSGIGDPPGDSPHKTSLSDRHWRQAMRMANSPLQAAAASSAKAASSANLNSIQNAAAASRANLNNFQNTDNFRFQ